jgi:two-component system chemotaxis response regulator CheB
MSDRIRALVVDDSLTIRKRIVEVLEASGDLVVVGEAADGREAIERCVALRPDVITLDMMLPVMSGLAATEYIMAHCPTPILIVSASVNRGELFQTYDALAAGAVDVLDKSSATDSEGAAAWEAALVAAVRVASRVKVITHPRARLRTLKASRAPLPLSEARERGVEVVAIGASTGGPGAVVSILRAIPAPYAMPLLVVVHIGAPFATAFAEWLDGQSPHHVVTAHGGEALASLAGRVVLPPPDRHLAVKGGHVVVSSVAPRHSCRPSVDVLFDSLAAYHEDRIAACLLTGMGRDGARGLLAIRRAGGVTIAQDEATSIIYGMPREAALLDAAERILPLPAIGPALAVLRPARGRSE